MDPARLKRIDLFASISDDALERFADMADETSISEGEELVRAGVVATSPVRAIFFTQDQVKRMRKDLPDLDDRLQALLEERS
jgi:hypothetical protein